MTKKAKKVRNYRATDSTMINVGASKKRDTVQNARIAALEKKVAALSKKVADLDNFAMQLLREVFPAKRKAATRR